MSFVAATAVRALGEGAYEGMIDTRWSAPNGPNGGYLAAIVVRAVEAEAASSGDAGALRSLTCHYLRPPGPGAAEVRVDVLRRGRTVTAARATMLQDGRTCVEALATLVVPAGGEPPSWEREAPEVPAAADVEPWPLHEAMPQISQRLELRPAVGATPLTGGEEALTGGWMRLREHDGPLDHAALALFADGWLPASLVRLTEPHPVPTLDLTIHFRRARPPEGDQVLGVFRSTLAGEGLVEEDAELYDEAGRLVAHARQLSLLR